MSVCRQCGIELPEGVTVCENCGAETLASSQELKDEVLLSHDKRRRQVYLDDDDVVAKVLDVREGDYECVMVNSDWLDKGLLAGDIVLFSEGSAALPGDIVLIEEDGHTRL